MTKEKFLKMLNDEIEKLNQKYFTVLQRYNYFKEIDPTSNEFFEAKYQLEIIQQEIETIKKFISFPSLARIEAMTDTEIEEHKETKIKELEEKIKNIKEKEKQAKEKLSQLKAEQEKLITQFESLSEKEKEEAIIRGKRILGELETYNANNKDGIFTTYKEEIEETKNEQENIKNKTPQEVKKELSDKLKESEELSKLISEISNTTIDSSIELLAAVAYNPEKALQMAKLLADYKKLDTCQKKVCDTIYLPYNLPTILIKELEKTYYIAEPDFGERKKITTEKPEILLTLITEFEEKFNKDKQIFKEQFTEEKLTKLIGKDKGVKSSEVDIEFLEQHKDKISEDKLKNLKNLVAKRNMLSNKIFKTKNIKKQIQSLNNQIIQEQSEIYKEIIKWYKEETKHLLGFNDEYTYLNYENLLNSQELLNSILKMTLKYIDDSESNLIELKESYQKAKESIDKKRQEYETEKNEIAIQIRNLGGSHFAETTIPCLSTTVSDNLNYIKKAAYNIQAAKIISEVQEEAQKQAAKKEKELNELEKKAKGPKK